jgi:hypothetical protein
MGVVEMIVAAKGGLPSGPKTTPRLKQGHITIQDDPVHAVVTASD